MFGIMYRASGAPGPVLGWQCMHLSDAGRSATAEDEVVAEERHRGHHTNERLTQVGESGQNNDGVWREVEEVDAVTLQDREEK